MYWKVEVEDRLTHDIVCVCDLAEKSEALQVVRVLKASNCCDVYVTETDLVYKKGKHE